MSSINSDLSTAPPGWQDMDPGLGAAPYSSLALKFVKFCENDLNGLPPAGVAPAGRPAAG